MGVNVIGYYIDEDVRRERVRAQDVFLVYENYKEGKPRGTWLEVYEPVGEHMELKDKVYLKMCTKISKEEYMEITKGYYTPEEYL